MCPISFNFVILHFRFCGFQNFSASFQTLSNFRNVNLIIWKRWRDTKTSLSQLPRSYWINDLQSSQKVMAHSGTLLKSLSIFWNKLERSESNTFSRWAQKLTGENLKFVWAEFSTIGWAVLKMCMKLMYADAYAHL